MNSDILRLGAAIVAVLLLLGIYLWIRRPWSPRQPKFTTEASRAIAFARVEAGRLGSSTIEPIHILLGLLHVPLPQLMQFLPLEEHEPIRQEIREHVTAGEELAKNQDIPFGEESSHVLVAAAREANGLSSRQIGAEHLLLGLLHSETSLAALMLRERGLRLEAVRARLGGWQE